MCIRDRYDNYNKKITKFIAEKRSMTENKEGKILINKNYVEYKAEKVDKNRPVTYAGFKWNGKAFACSMAGLYACAHYCGVWAIVNPIAGGVCEAVCGTSFAAGCFFQAEDGIRDRSVSRGLGDVYKRQIKCLFVNLIHMV
ncbi:putative immunity/bacteriocin fusion bifunctional protein, partial [Staphylococcus aureus]